MKIRKATKKDLRNYIIIKKEGLKEYSKIAKKRIILNNNQIKKELFEAISNPKRIILFVENEMLEGYIIGSIIVSEHKNYGYIDDIFIFSDYRKKGLATLLVREFIKILKKRKIRNIGLGVNIRNKKAIELYKKLGFEMKHYGMEKVL